MDRLHDLLNNIQDSLSGAQKTYKGQKRSELKDSDFLFPETRSFPIVTPQDVPDAINNFGRMKGQMSYESFLRKLYNKIKNKPDFVAALPEASKQQLGLKKKAAAACGLKAGDMVRNINPACVHYGSEGIVQNIEELPDHMGQVVVYKTVNAGPSWNPGDMLKKTEDQLANMQMMQRREPSLTINEIEEPSDLLADDYENDEDEEEYDDPMEIEIEKIEKEIELEMLKQKLAEIKKSKGQDFTKVEEMEEESVLMEMMEYKNDFYEMSLGSLRAIATHANEILNSLDNPNVKENLTESWLQGKIAITEDYMRTIHDFIMYVTEAADNTSAVKRPGLWENIRKKKERMGKNYKPAKPGDKDRPDPEQWKKLQKENKKDKKD